MDVSWKVWLSNENTKVFGKGPKELLININEFGSIRKAAEEMNLSYSKALRLIKTIETEMNFSVLERQVGGPSGGGSVLTKEAKDLIEKFDTFENKVEAMIKKIYEETF